MFRIAELFSTPAMVAVLVAVVLVEACSLLLLLLVVTVFRSQSKKYRELLANLGDTESFGRPGRFLIPLYIALTLGFTLITMLIFIFQPHLL